MRGTPRFQEARVKITRLIVALAAAAALTAAAPSAGATTARVTEPTWNPHASYRLVLAATFGGTKVDTRLWNTGWFGTGITKPVNPQSPPDSSANVTVAKGTLNLKLARYGALVDTDGHFSIGYGSLEVRACLPAAAGGQVADWPSIWLNGQTWPADGEIDIGEGLAGRMAVHLHETAGVQGWTVPGKWTGCHDFGVTRAPGVVTVFYDGRDVGQARGRFSAAPEYLVIANSSGDGGPAALTRPPVMRVEWVRAWT
jgi:beta-glucanase (GH16 family)